MLRFKHTAYVSKKPPVSIEHSEHLSEENETAFLSTSHKSGSARAGKGLGYIHFTLVFRPLTPSASKDFKKKLIKHWKKKSFDVAAREEIG